MSYAGLTRVSNLRTIAIKMGGRVKPGHDILKSDDDELKITKGDTDA
jgi:hypothetical protein